MKKKMNLSDLWGGCIWSSRKPQTNYDLLISKTQEELAEKMVDYSYCPPGAACKPTCKECWLSWLKSPVEVET